MPRARTGKLQLPAVQGLGSEQLHRKWCRSKRQRPGSLNLRREDTAVSPRGAIARTGSWARQQNGTRQSTGSGGPHARRLRPSAAAYPCCPAALSSRDQVDRIGLVPSRCHATACIEDDEIGRVAKLPRRGILLKKWLRKKSQHVRCLWPLSVPIRRSDLHCGVNALLTMRRLARVTNH